MSHTITLKVINPDMHRTTGIHIALTFQDISWLSTKDGRNKDTTAVRSWELSGVE